MKNGEPMILHVEDDQRLADLVRTAFMHLGFRGEMVSARSVTEAIRVLNERAQNRKPINLIITDIQLPDGTGLDLIREVKSDPAWRLTPVIVLSHEVDAHVINDAYALGANSYLSKDHSSANILGSLQNIYHYWLESARLPHEKVRDRLQDALERSIILRTRTAEFYLRLARAFEGSPEESVFWLERALNEGNLSNLLVFFRNKLRERDVKKKTIDRLIDMQTKVKNALSIAEEHLRAVPAPPSVLAYQWALSLTDAFDEAIFAEALGVLFPKSAVATMALKARAAAQITELSSHILERTRDEGLHRKADALLNRFQSVMSDHS